MRLAGQRRVAGVLEVDAIGYGLTMQAGARLLLDTGTAVATSLGFRIRAADDGIYSAGAGYVATPAAINVGTINLSDLYTYRYSHVVPSAAQAITAVGNTILANAAAVQISSNGVYTLTSTPTILDGAVDGQELSIVNVGVNPVTLQSAASFNLRLGAATRQLAQYGVICLIWSTTLGDWLETSHKS